MSTPRQPNRIPEYSSDSNYYPRELVEKDGKLKLISQDGTVTDLNSNADLAVKGTASGEIIRVDDVSPIKHNPTVSVKTKNHFNISVLQPTTTSSIYAYISEIGESYINIITPAGHTGVGCANSTKTLRELCPQLEVGKTYTLYLNTSVSTVGQKAIYLADAAATMWFRGCTLTITEVMLKSQVAFYGHTATEETKTVTISDIMIVEGTADDIPDSYIPYVDPSTVSLTRYGKNLYKSTVDTQTTNGVTITRNEDNSYTINGTATKESYFHIGSIPANDNLTCYLSGGASSNVYLACQCRLGTTNVTSIISNDNGHATVINISKTYNRPYDNFNLVIAVKKGVTSSNVVVKPMISFSSDPTYEPYIKPVNYQIEADGAVDGVTSLSPTMTLLTDTEGTVIDLEYLRDSITSYDLATDTMPGLMSSEDKIKLSNMPEQSVPITRTINGKELSSDITLSASDVGALPSTTTIPTASTTAPKAAGTAAVGTGTTWARADHVHPLQTAISGNAGTATKLASGVSIGLSGVTATAQSFDGSKAITIPITAVPASLVTGLAAVATSGSYDDLSDTPTLATVATSGAYSDLSGKPTIPTASTTTPLVAGTATYGSGTSYARSNHVHPLQTSVSGNAGTATKLASGNTINGVTFTGASPITITANPTVNALSSSQNLNSLITQGMHYAAAGNSCTNKPTGVDGFGIIVYRTEYWAQLLTADNGLMYVRTANDTSGSSWDNWTPVYTGTNPPAHTTITTSDDTTTTSAPSAGGTFTAIDTVTRDANGHVTTLRTKTITIPSNTKRGYGYGTCSTAASTTAKVATLSNYALTTGGYVTVRFTYAVPASATLNVNSTGAKSIYNNGAAIKAGVINAGDTATFVYNGTYYYLVSTSTPSRTYTANVTTTWTGSEAPYTQTITVSGMTANDNPVVDVVPDSTYATATSQIAEYGKIYKITTAADSITVYATEKTETTVPIQLKCVR